MVVAEKQRDDALITVKALADRVEQLKLSSYKPTEFRDMPIHKLKSLQVSCDEIVVCKIFSSLILFILKSKLRCELEEVDNVLYSLTATKCMKCEEQKRTVTLEPCNHYVLCEACAPTMMECPYCQTPIEGRKS